MLYITFPGFFIGKQYMKTPKKVSTKVQRIIGTLCRMSIYNRFHNILRLFDVLPNFPFAASKTMCDYYL